MTLRLALYQKTHPTSCHMMSECASLSGTSFIVLTYIPVWLRMEHDYQSAMVLETNRQDLEEREQHMRQLEVNDLCVPTVCSVIITLCVMLIPCTGDCTGNV